MGGKEMNPPLITCCSLLSCIYHQTEQNTIPQQDTELRLPQSCLIKELDTQNINIRANNVCYLTAY